MPDNTKQSADENIATDDIGTGVAAGAKVQRMKAGFGADGSYSDVSSSSPLPTVDAELVALLTERLSSGGTGSIAARGNAAHDAVDSGNPVKVGGRARTALPTAVAQDDRADAILDKFGRQLTVVAPLDERVSATITRTNAEAGQLLAALATGAYVVTAITVTNASASVSTKVEVLDGETVKWRGYAVKEGGGFVVGDPNGLFLGTKNTALRARCATNAADVDVTVSAYKVPA